MGGHGTEQDALRVLLVSQPTDAGTARHVADLAEGLQSTGGVTVTVACPRGGMLNDRLGKAGIAVVEVPMAREIGPVADLRAFLRLLSICRRSKPDVLHLHSSKAGFLGRVAGRIAGVGAVVFTPHCWSFQSASGRKRGFYLALERFASRFCDLTVTVSEREAAEAVENGIVRRDRLRVIPNGVASSEFHATPDASRDIPFLSVGRLDEQKGYRYLIEAMAELVRTDPQASLVLVGDGSLRAELEELARSLGIAHAVRFEGEQPSAAPYLRRAHVFVLSSLWEGLPYTIIEAMAAGLPVVGTDVGGCGELVLNGETGLLVPPRDPAALAGAMRALWADEPLRRRFGGAGRVYALRRFRIEDCVAGNARAYRETLAAKRDRGEVGPAAIFGRRGAAVLLTLAVAASAWAIGDRIVYRDRILPGVRIASVDVGGATVAEATSRLDAAMTSPVRVSFPDTSAVVGLDATATGVDVRSAVRAAFSAGRVGALPQRIGERIEAARGRVVVPVVASRQGAVADLLAQAGQRLDRAPADAGFALRDGEAVVVPSVPGARVEVGRLLAALGEAAVSPSGAGRNVRVPVTTVPPRVADADAEAHLAEVDDWTSAPVAGSVRGAEVELAPEAIASCLAVEGATLDVSPERLRAALRSEPLPVSSPRNAEFAVSGGVPVIVDSMPGVEVDATSTATALRSALGSGEKRFTIALATVQPDITESDLGSLGITREISSSTTHFDPDVDGRDDNIALASKAIRGQVVGVGEVFSLNETTGPRGRTSGYKEALVFLNGKVVPGIGGGVCQVSSTLYDAALLAGLRIVERHSHSMTVSYMDPGRDATAYYPTLDLKFQNTTGGPIMVWTEVRGDALTISFYGSTGKPDIRIETVVRKTTQPGRHVVYDTALAHNEQEVEATGRPGYTVSSYRLTYEGGRVVQREPLATDVYQPRDWVIRTGI